MLSRQEEEADRIRTLHNDLKVREQQGRVYAQDQSQPRQSGTLHQHAINEASIPLGRFSAISNAQVVGQGAQYSAAGPHQHDPCGPEPPLGYRVDALFPDNPALEPSADDEAQATGPTPQPLAPLGEARVGSFSPSGDMMADGEQSRSKSDGYVVSPVRFRRRV
jgi:hypothetical protein